MIVKPGKDKYDDIAVEKIYELTAGNAFLIMKICDMLVDYANEKKFPKINASIVDSYIDECVKKLENIDFDSQYSDNSGTEEENKQTEKKIKIFCKK